jgi:hypothetical protein
MLSLPAGVALPAGPPMRRPLLAPHLALATLLLAARGALAQAPALPPPESEEDDTSPLIAPAADTLGGHLVLALSPAVAVPGGSFDRSQPAARLGPGWGGGADIGFGINRAVALGVYGQYFVHQRGSGPTRVTASEFTVGPFVRYHVVQGLRFDPWVLVGAGYHAATVTERGVKQKFSGLQWLRFAVGGDYYLFSGLAFGPFVELDLGSFLEHPAKNTPATVHFAFLAGLRFTFDTPGK